MPRLRIATFNLENLDETAPNARPTLAQRIAVMRPQLARVDADIICLQEVHSQDVNGQRELAALQQLIQGTQYASPPYTLRHSVTSNGILYDERNLVVISRFPFVGNPENILHDIGEQPLYQFATRQPPQAQAQPVRWERPLLVVQLNLGSNRTLHLINLHLKSKIPSNIEGQRDPNNRFRWLSVSGWAEGYFYSSMKRVGQALEARMKIDQLFDQDATALIVVCGDFNSDLDAVPVKTICGPVEETGNTDLVGRIMVPCEKNVPEPSRYSLLHLGQGEMLDHIIVSRWLLQYFHHTEIHNEALPDESGAFRTDDKFPESDHAPVVAEFDLP